MLCQLSYARRIARRRDSNPQPLDYQSKEPPAAQQAGSHYRLDNRIGSGCEARVRTPNSWFRARCDASSTTSHWSGREDSNPHHRHPKPACCTLNTTSSWYRRRDSNPHCPPSEGGASTSWATSAWWTERDSNPQPSPCRGAALPDCATGPRFRCSALASASWRVRGSNPPDGLMRPV